MMHILAENHKPKKVIAIISKYAHELIQSFNVLCVACVGFQSEFGLWFSANICIIAF